MPAGRGCSNAVELLGNHMRMVILALAAALVVSPALASDKTDATATVKQYNDDFNKDDTQSGVAL